jgi:hypothetical protein
MPTQAIAVVVGAHDHGDSIPADQGADAPLHEQVAGHGRLLGGADRIVKRRRDGTGQAHAAVDRVLGDLAHQVVGAFLTGVVDNTIERVHPFARLGRVAILQHRWVGVLHAAVSCADAGASAAPWGECRRLMVSFWN